MTTTNTDWQTVAVGTVVSRREHRAMTKREIREAHAALSARGLVFQVLESDAVRVDAYQDPFAMFE